MRRDEELLRIPLKIAVLPKVSFGEFFCKAAQQHGCPISKMRLRMRLSVNGVKIKDVRGKQVFDQFIVKRMLMF